MLDIGRRLRRPLCSLRIAALEVALDFDERIVRFGLRPPAGKKRDDAVVPYVESWRELMVAAKVEQSEAVHCKDLALPRLPWPCLGVDSMPCVFWVHIPQKHTEASTSNS